MCCSVVVNFLFKFSYKICLYLCHIYLVHDGGPGRVFREKLAKKEIKSTGYFCKWDTSTSDGGNGIHSVSLPIILLKVKADHMLPSLYIS